MDVYINKVEGNNENEVQNPLLAVSSLPFGAPMFDKIHNHDYMPAFNMALKKAYDEIDKIAENPQAPSFENTIEALEYSGMDLDKVCSVFFNLLEADSDDEKQNIAEEISPKLTEFSMYVSQNEKLFKRVKAVVAQIKNVDSQQKRLLENTYKDFLRSGADLQSPQKERFKEISERLSLLQLKFSHNVLEATKEFVLVVEQEKLLTGLPTYLMEEAKAEAERRKVDGWAFTLDFTVYNPFMKFCENRDLRHKMYMAYNSRAIDGKFDNKNIIAEIVALRAEKAELLGYDTYADYALEERMAKKKSTVEEFLTALMSKTLPFAEKDVARVEEYAKLLVSRTSLDSQLSTKVGNQDVFDFMPWDFKYYAEKLKQEKYSFDDSLIKPYFKLEKCLDAIFGLAGKLYGLKFIEKKDIPVYHEDVMVFDVLDSNSEHLSLLYMDFFPRKSKSGGAWMTEFRGQFSYHGKDYRPFISVVTNVSKPTKDKPSLLTHNELTTLLHEFGHALHGMLSRGKYPSMSGTSVARDFVELPSQIMENWAFEPEFLKSFAAHYQTGETIPEEYVTRIVEAKNFLSGYSQVRQLQFGYIDMAWHVLSKKQASEVTAEKVIDFEKEALKSSRTLKYIPGTVISTTFGHIFSGGYSAGYYSYKWAEVLEADAFALFLEKGIFSREAADRFRINILEKGSSEDEMKLYVDFRGHRPNQDSLMEKLGLKN